MLFKCSACGFHLRDKSKPCHGCGNPSPAEAPVDEGALAGCGSLLFASAGLVIGLFERNRFLPFILAVVFAVVGYYGLKALFWVIGGPKRKAAADDVPCLDRTARLITERLDDLKERLDRIGSLRTRIESEPAGERWAGALKTLEAAREATQAQRDRYRAQQARIELLRWLNGTEPLHAALEGLWKLDDEAKLAELKAGLTDARKSAQAIQARWRASALAEQAEVVSAVGQLDSALQQLDKALADCETVRQELLARQVLALAAETQPVQETLEAVRLAHQHPTAPPLDQAWANPEGFFDHFDQLEGEYGRLKSEDLSAELQTELA